MLKKSTLVAIVALSAATLAGCDVDQTQEGDVKLPEYNVEQTEGGNVTPPAVEVTPPDVDLKREEANVMVPQIETEERRVEIPSVDVEPAPEGEKR